jgi:replicative DNA helicase
MNLDALKKIEQQALKSSRVLKYKTLLELAPDFLDSLVDEDNKLMFGIPSFDNVTQGKLRGRLITIAGVAGSMKSLLSCQIGQVNAKHDVATFYWSGEMVDYEVFSRVIDSEIDWNGNDKYKIQTSHIIEGMVKQGKRDEAQQLINDCLRSVFGERFVISQDSDVDSAVLKNTILKYNSEHEAKIGVVVVDGLSMMAEAGTENDSVMKHSKELKELAKDLNICVILLAHPNKTAQPTYRDLTHSIRSSQKLIDNSDFIFTISLIEDIENSTPDAPVYMNNCRWIRGWFKRADGSRRDIILDFNSTTLRLSESSILASDVQRATPKKDFF